MPGPDSLALLNQKNLRPFAFTASTIEEAWEQLKDLFVGPGAVLDHETLATSLQVSSRLQCGWWQIAPRDFHLIVWVGHPLQ